MHGAVAQASAVGFAMSFAARARGEGRELRGAILAPPDAREAVRMLLPAFATPVDPTSWIASATQAVDLSSTTAFIAGGAAFIQQTRAALRAHGFGRRQIRSHAFWATGRVGLG